ncbi:MAG: hypothetical protein AAF479_02580 [Pseudomonadota bacterium]
MSLIGRMIAYAGMGLAITTATGITAVLIAEKAVPPDFRQKVLCAAGQVDLAGSTCLSQQMANHRRKLDQEMARLRQQSEAQVRAANQARDTAVQSLAGNMRFDEGPSIAGMTVVVGTSYKDHAARTGLIRSICWGTRDRGGLDPRVTLAQMGPDGVPVQASVDTFEMSVLGVDLSDIEAARAECPWPSVS